jgi:hypothetical protein
VQVRNAFGVERTSSVRVVLPHVAERPSAEVVSMREGGKP